MRVRKIPWPERERGLCCVLSTQTCKELDSNVSDSDPVNLIGSVYFGLIQVLLSDPDAGILIGSSSGFS